jgi:hypothetical protein
MPELLLILQDWNRLRFWTHRVEFASLAPFAGARAPGLVNKGLR